MAKIVQKEDGTYSIEGIMLGDGRESSTGKSTILFTDRIKSSDGMVAQVNIYYPNSKL